MKTYHDQLMEDPEFRRLSTLENLTGEASNLIAKLMHDQGVTRADLARKLNKSRAFVTQILSGSHNVTVKTLAEVLYHLDIEVKLDAQPLPGTRTVRKPHNPSATVRSEAYKLYPGKRPQDVFTLKSDLLANECDAEELVDLPVKQDPHAA